MRWGRSIHYGVQTDIMVNKKLDAKCHLTKASIKDIDDHLQIWELVHSEDSSFRQVHKIDETIELDEPQINGDALA